VIISELIEELNHILNECGDVEVRLAGTYPDVHFAPITEINASFYHHENTKTADLYQHTGEMPCQYGDECEAENAPVVALLWTH